MENELELAGRHIDLGTVTMPVSLILARDDKFVPADASLPFLDVIPRRQWRAILEFSVELYDLGDV